MKFRLLFTGCMLMCTCNHRWSFDSGGFAVGGLASRAIVFVSEAGSQSTSCASRLFLEGALLKVEITLYIGPATYISFHLEQPTKS